MLEIEFVLNELEKMKAKEKSLKARHFLGEAIDSIKRYDKTKKDF